MAQRFHLTGLDALVRGLGNISFQHVDDTGRLTGYGLVGVLARSATILVGTVIIGGIVLSAANAFVAGLFGVPEFGELRSLGFTMAAVLGLWLAGWFLVRNLRHPVEMD